MNFLPLHFGMTSNLFVYLRRYLNEILKLNPPLAEINKFDSELGKAIGQFLVRYNTLYPEKKLPIIITASNELFAAVGVMLGETRLREEVEALKISEPIVVKLLQGQPPVSYPPYTAEMQACDKKLAEILGGKGAVAKGNGSDIGGQYRGSMGAGDTDAHLHLRMHLYESEDGLKVTEVYLPEGAGYIGKNPYSDEDSYMFYYKKLGKTSNATIIFSHIANFIRPKIGEKFSVRTKIGEIGGKGGKSGGGKLGDEPPYKYIHAHISIQRGRGNTNKLIPFPDVFC